MHEKPPQSSCSCRHRVTWCFVLMGIVRGQHDPFLQVFTLSGPRLRTVLPRTSSDFFFHGTLLAGVSASGARNSKGGGEPIGDRQAKRAVRR